MNRTEQSRKKRNAKSKKTNLMALAVIGILIVLAIILRLTVFSKNSSDIKTDPNKKTTELSKTEETEKKNTEKEKAELEASRKEKYGEFYVPLPEEPVKANDTKVKGIYLNHNNVGLDFSEENIANFEKYIEYVNGNAENYPAEADNANVIEQMLAICNKTEVNGIVIDIKTDDGYLTWESDIEAVNKFGTDASGPYFNYEKLINYMKEHNIVPIARIVTFKDLALPDKAPEHAMELKDGSIYYDDSGTAWVNQYDKYVWDYVLSISKEAAYRGFEEIHFDYVRFPDNAADYDPIVAKPEDAPRKDENIENFLNYAKQELEPYGVGVGAAVFGIITSTWEDEPDGIGQTWIKLADEVDTISPMIYPSHYSEGWYGIEQPDFDPYGMFHSAISDAIEKNSAVKSSGRIRPWIQGFTASYMDVYEDYDAKTIAEQVRASVELGVDEYLIWNALNEYDPEIFKYTSSFTPNPVVEESSLPEYSFEDLLKEDNGEEAKVQDKLGRTPYQIAKMFLDSLIGDNSGRIFLISAKDTRADSYGEFLEDEIFNQYYDSYQIIDANKADKGYVFNVEVYNGEETSDVEIKVILEDGLFKIGNLDKLAGETRGNN